MIKNLDRSGYFGASDTRYVMADNRDTESWKRWWREKLGAPTEFAGNRSTIAGTMWEHPILDALDKDITKDGQIIIEDKRIRVNYDGYKDGVIYEVKTHSAKKEFKVTDAYWCQCQVEMYAYQEMHEKWFLPPFQKLYIVEYPLDDADYDLALAADATGDMSELIANPNKINKIEVAYAPKFIKRYLHKVRRLAGKLDRMLGGENEAHIERESEGDPNIDSDEKDSL